MATSSSNPRKAHGMAQPHIRLALMGALAVVLVMAVAIAAFNVYERWQLEREATASVDEALGWQVQGNVAATRIAYTFYLDEDGQFTYSFQSSYTLLDEQIASYCWNRGELNVVQKVQMQNSTCYAELCETNAYERQHGPDSARSAYALGYVDVTPQLELINTISVLLAIIALVGTVTAGAAGWHAGRRIEKAQDAQKRFYENMSHELKTPLAAIRGYADGIVENIMDPIRSARAIARESDRMTRLVEQILDISRLEAGAIPLNVEEVEMEDFVQDVLMPFEGIVHTRGLEVDLELAEGSETLDVDLFGHALENVLSNAIRHAEHEVRIRWDGTRLTVWNDGTMPDPHELTHMFDRYRVGSGGSTGIGLALAQEIVRLHGWDIRAALVDEGMQVSLVPPHGN